MVCLHKKGYTLVELIMVMVIIGIISVVFVTRIVETSALNYGIQLSAIRDHIRYASDYAMANGVKTVVSFDVGDNQYSIFYEDGSGRTLMMNPEDGQDFIINLDTDRFKGMNLTGIDVNGTNEVKFMPYGVPFDANDTKLTSQAYVQINSTNVITIYPVSGLCRVME